MTHPSVAASPFPQATLYYIDFENGREARRQAWSTAIAAQANDDAKSQCGLSTQMLLMSNRALVERGQVTTSPSDTISYLALAFQHGPMARRATRV